MRPRITFLSPFVPYAAIPHAGGQFLYRYVRHLSTFFEITVIAPDSERNRAGKDAGVPVDFHLVPVRRRPRTLVGFAPRLVANTLAGVTPGWQVLRGFRRDPTVWQRIEESDLVELEWSWYLPFVRDIRGRCPRLPVIAFEYDVLTESLARRARSGDLRERTFGRVAAARARKVEPALLNRCDAVFTFSERDRSLLRQLGVRTDIDVVSPPVDRRERACPDTRRPTVLFVGAMDRPENHEGAAWLATEVWPAVERSCPGARLVLAGTLPPASLQRLAGGSVDVPGYVADLELLYRHATVFVAPNLTGAGVKFKVLDALSHGLPVVATPVAAEGIAEASNSPGFAAITDDAVVVGTTLVQLLSGPARAREIGDAGREWVRARYDFDRSMAAVVTTYERLIGRA